MSLFEEALSDLRHSVTLQLSGNSEPAHTPSVTTSRGSASTTRSGGGSGVSDEMIDEAVKQHPYFGKFSGAR